MSPIMIRPSHVPTFLPSYLHAEADGPGPSSENVTPKPAGLPWLHAVAVAGAVPIDVAAPGFLLTWAGMRADG